MDTDIFTTPATEEALQNLAARLKERNIEATIVADEDSARALVIEKIPIGAEVHFARSKTLQDTGISDFILNSGQYDALRNRYLKMDRQTEEREIRKLVAGPDYMLGSVNAVTQDGVLVAASASASQVGPYAYTAGKVILVVGSQKIVPDLEAALRRIRDYVLPWEDAQVRLRKSTGSFVGKILIIERERTTGRMEVILVRKVVGI